MSRRGAWWLVTAVALVAIAALVLGSVSGAAPAPSTPDTLASSTPGTPASGPAGPLPSAAVAPQPAPASTAAVATTAAADGTPAPFVQTFAAQPGVRRQPALASPTAARSMPVNLDGCDHGYGVRSQCVPWTFPAGVPDKCAWLAAHGFTRLPVTGADRHRLDPDGNGLACDG